jgi:quercetin dioxygenase-like cupin family protein
VQLVIQQIGEYVMNNTRREFIGLAIAGLSAVPFAKSHADELDIVKAKPEEWEEYDSFVGGKGKVMARISNKGTLSEYADSFLVEFVFSPKAYCGYHKHGGLQEILFVVSGRGEHYYNGQRSKLEPGDSVVVGKEDGAHAFRNIGSTNFRAIGVFTTPKGVEVKSKELPLPKDIADWEEA